MKNKLRFLFLLLCLLTCRVGVSAQSEKIESDSISVAVTKNSVTIDNDVMPDARKVNSDAEWINVGTAADFFSAVKSTDSNGNHTANIRLTEDIDLSSHSSDDGCIFNFEFKGKIDGEYTNSVGQKDYHMLKNSKSHLLFRSLSGAEITNLAIVDCSYDGWDTHSGWLGATATNCLFQNIVMSNVDAIGHYTTHDKDRMGGLIGDAEKCTFNNIVAMDVDIECDGYMVGCIAGKATDCSFSNIFTNILCSIFADGNFEDGVMTNTSAYAGGIVGYAVNSDISQCVNMALVCANDDRVGGIVGFGKSTTVADCFNYGLIAHIEEVEDFETIRDKVTEEAEIKYDGLSGSSLTAVIFGYASFHALWGPISCLAFLDELISGSMTMVELAAEASIMLDLVSVLDYIVFAINVYLIYDYQDPDELGGIAGHMQEGSYVKTCINYGYVYGSDAHVGGIVGYLKNSYVSDCCNQYRVKGVEQTGGIVGTNDNGSITSCLNASYAQADDSSDESIQIQGYTKGTVTLKGNCFSSYYDGTSTTERPVSQLSLASGSVAAYLNTYSQKWTQNIGTDFYPTPTAAIRDTTVISDGNINTNVNIIHSVSTCAELKTELANPAARISLTEDIDMNNMSTTLYGRYTPFYGAIYGNGHSIKNVNFSVDDSEEKIDALNTALFPVTKHAVFDNIVLDNIKVTHKNAIAGTVHTEAILAGTSNNSKYNNISLRNCSICLNSDKDYLSEVGGIVAISNSDTLTNCTAESTCQFQGYSGWRLTDTNVGGLVSKAYNTIFTQCWNAASIWADDNQEGGIVAYASGCKIDRCLNTRGITAQENVGGICGNGYNTVITRCVNTSWISDDDNTREDRRAGIVGYLHGSGASISQCLNFGPINYADDDCGALEGCAKDGAKSAKNTNSFYYCGYNNGHADNQSEYSDASIFRIAKINSGEFAYKSTIDQVEGADKWLYQDIDNSTFCTNYPVPIPAAGTVYSNILCDGTQSYSNKYNSTAAHTAVDDGFGICSICGTIMTKNITTAITISDAAGLIRVSNAVNRGVDYSNTTITLANDIDLNGYSYTPIGLDSSNPFKGTFDGQGHRIKNMTLSYAQGGVGFFGNVSGANTVIKNLIIDSSCSVTSTSGGGVAGLIGDVTSTSGSTCNITIENCGNEADVTGYENVAGLLGGVYSNNATVVNINNCYNSGAISGNTGKCSASIVGYARLHTSIRNTWNCGSVGGTQNYYTFAGTWETTSGRGKFDGTIENCYTTNTIETSKSGVTKISSDEVTYGTLCNKLNENHDTYSSWAQNIESDTHPVFGDGSLTFSRSTADQWTTVVLPFDVKISDTEQYMFYSISAVADSIMSLSKISGTLSAGTPAIVYMDDTAKDSTDKYVLSLASNGNISSTINNPAAVGGLTLTGVYNKTAVTNVSGYKLVGDYFYNLAANDSAKTIYCEPYTAYLAGTLDNNAEKLTILSDIVNISTPDELIAFSNDVNSGSDYTNSIVILNNDIDMSGCEFTPIGSDTHPFRGTFNGNCHRIKNLTINSTQARTGFFGTVATGGTLIKNLIIDSSCSITSTGTGVAGLVGGVIYASHTTKYCTIRNCGNEAAITGRKNVAGIVGGVYNSDYTNLTINNCYNTGAITGTKESSSICAWARMYFTIKNCYNTGSLTGGETGQLFFRYLSEAVYSVSNNYDINGTQIGVSQLSSDDAALGILCQNLNAGSSSSAKARKAMRKATTNAFGEVELGNSVWTQNIATDSTPTFGENGLLYTRNSAFRFGAIVLPFDITVNDSNPYDFYTLSIVTSGDTIVVRKVINSILAAGTPAFLVMKEQAKDAETGNYGLSVAPTSDAKMTTTVDNSLSIGGLTLKGVFYSKDITNETGYIAYGDTVVNISSLAEKVGSIICPAFNAYISGSLSLNPSSLTVIFDLGDNDDPTAIGAITKSLGESDIQVFDLNGRMMPNLQKGVNIVRYSNGQTRKVIVR